MISLCVMILKFLTDAWWIQNEFVEFVNLFSWISVPIS